MRNSLLALTAKRPSGEARSFTFPVVRVAIGAACIGIGWYNTPVAMASAIPASSLDPLFADYRRPAVVPAPADNPVTPAKVVLGRALFFDPELSHSGKTSCGTCHDPERGWQDGRARAVGDRGTRLPRRTPTILNSAWLTQFFWDGRADSLEDQAIGPLVSPAEMNMPIAGAIRILSASPIYRARFAAAYPGQKIGARTIAGAIASFERTVVSSTAPFDRRVAGDRSALLPAAERGFVLFQTTAGCASCHTGWRFTDDAFHDIGLPGNDVGRARITPGITTLRHAFKTPTLRSVAAGGPFMHDGSLPTLTAVIDYYNAPASGRASIDPTIRPLHLSRQQRSDLIAFLQTLSSPDRAPMDQTKSPRKD